MFNKLAALFLIASSALLMADEDSLAGTWKYVPEKSNGPVPAFAQDGLLTIPPRVFKGGPDPSRWARHVATTGVYRFVESPDGRILTVTQPNKDARSIFERK